MIRVALVGCGKSKRPGSHPARDLYAGPLFRAALAHAERTAERVFIVSAKYGLLPLDRVVESYEQRLVGRKSGRLLWAATVVLRLLEQLPDSARHVTIYAGADYAEPIAADLARLPGFTCELPLERLTQGARLAWFKQRRPVAP